MKKLNELVDEVGTEGTESKASPKGGKVKVGTGIFGWPPYERKSDRYGFFFLDSGKACLETKNVLGLVGRRVRLSAVVIEARDSKHVGDLFHGIFPSRPSVGEVVDMGTGTLSLGPKSDGTQGEMVIGLVPEDGREYFWIDPRKLYRLHDQTVELWAEAA